LGAHKSVIVTPVARAARLNRPPHTINPWRQTMFNQKFFDEISAKLSEVAASSPAKDIEKNVRALLAQGFSKLDLVTREEFDVQAQLLARARQKLDELEARVAALEAERGK
jgi:BMFP domain-containing protein YqiC